MCNTSIKQKRGIAKIGTSNIVLPGSRQTFPEAYQQTSRLHYYGALFNTLEITSSFYKIPMPATFEKWRWDVPENFRFTVKLYKEITHAKALQCDAALIEKFLKAASYLGDKRGCLLMQFPGKITLSYFNQVGLILQLVNAAGKAWKVAAEFRSDTWYTAETNELLNEYGASMVLHDMQKTRNGEVNKGADTIYLRFHGPTGNYRGKYSNIFLQEKATQIEGWLKAGKDVYAYFNNTIGSAFQNAVYLKNLMEK